MLVGERTKNLLVLLTLRIGRPFLSQCQQNPGFYDWRVYTQKNGGRAFRKVCFLMGAKLRHGVLKSAAFTARLFKKFRKFIEKLSVIIILYTEKKLQFSIFLNLPAIVQFANGPRR